MDDREHAPNASNAQIIKDVVDLNDLLETFRKDCPKMGLILREMGISPLTMSNSVRTAHATICATYPDVGLDVLNRFFKYGVALGHAFKAKREMEQRFNTDDALDSSNEEEK